MVDQPPPPGDKNRLEQQTLTTVLKTMYEVSNMPLRKSLNATYQLLKARQMAFSLYEGSRAKSTITAIDWKNIGTERFIASDYVKATDAFTKCLAFALEDSEEAAYAYANRSAVLFKLNQFEQCIEDVDRALAGVYPEEKKQNLRDRKERCVVLLDEYRRVRLASGRASAEELHATDEWRKMCKFTNPLIPNASAKIKLEYNETWGRHLVATEDIEPGEVLCEETCFSTALMLQRVMSEYCSYCLKNYFALIPCPTCSMAMYCSTQCRTQAYKSYHRLECQLMALKEVREDYKDVGDFLALLTLLIGTEQGAGLETLMKKLPMEDILANNCAPLSEPFTSDYLHLLKLCRIFPKPLFDDTVGAEAIVGTIIALRKVGFFRSDPDQQNATAQGTANGARKHMSEPELYTALLLCNHMISFKSNLVPIREVIADGQKFKEPHILGMGVNILCNMINHSCNAQTRILIHDRDLALLTVRPIKKGEQIFRAYVQPYWINSLSTRIDQLKLLSGYPPFTCRCEPCVNEWPIYSNPLMREVKLLGKNKQKMRNELNGMVLSFVQQPVANLSRMEILKFLSQLSTWIHSHIQEPCYMIVDCEDLIADYMTYFYSRGFIPGRTIEGWTIIANVNLVLRNILAYELCPGDSGREV